MKDVNDVRVLTDSNILVKDEKVACMRKGILLEKSSGASMLHLNDNIYIITNNTRAVTKNPDFLADNLDKYRAKNIELSMFDMKIDLTYARYIKNVQTVFNVYSSFKIVDSVVAFDAEREIAKRSYFCIDSTFSKSLDMILLDGVDFEYVVDYVPFLEIKANNINNIVLKNLKIHDSGSRAGFMVSFSQAKNVLIDNVETYYRYDKPIIQSMRISRLEVKNMDELRTILVRQSDHIENAYLLSMKKLIAPAFTMCTIDNLYMPRIKVSEILKTMDNSKVKIKRLQAIMDVNTSKLRTAARERHLTIESIENSPFSRDRVGQVYNINDKM